jgi:hypothetical protein
MQHHVADGMSGIHCINTWSEMARGIPLKVQPFIDRTLLKANSPPAPKYPHIEYQPPPRLLEREIANGIGNGRANDHGDGHGITNGASCKNGNGHSVNKFHVTNGKSNGNHVEIGKSNVGHGENGKSNGSHGENGKSNGSHVADGKSNGSYVESGKSNDSHGENGKSNGSYVERGKSNGSHVENGKSNGVENGKRHSNGNGYGGSNGAHHVNGNGNGNHKDAQSKGSKVIDGLHKSNGYSNGKAREEDIPMAVRVFKFTKEQLATLKQMAVEGKTDVVFSSYEMLSGHIWKCVTQARELETSQETKLFVATDGRSRLRPPLPEGYFGNVIFTCTPIATAGELVANPVTYAARKVSIHPPLRQRHRSSSHSIS